MKCPVCSKPMDPLHYSNGLPRTYCSRNCYYQGLRDSQDVLDISAVQRLVNGDPPKITTRAERTEATAILTGYGSTLEQIASRLRISERAVSRYRKALRDR